MGRFRSKKTFKLVTYLQGERPGPIPAWKREEEGLSRQLHDRWSALHRHCTDQSSHLRLGRLVRRLTNYDYGVRESALAELELATQLIRAGVRVTLLLKSNVQVIERAKHQQTQPRVRMLVLNPNTSAPLSESHDALIRQTL